MEASSASENPSDAQVAAIIASYDRLVDAVELHLEALLAEFPAAETTGDIRYHHRLDRGGRAARDLLNVLDGPVVDYIAELRHVASQLGVARQGKMV